MKFQIAVLLFAGFFSLQSAFAQSDDDVSTLKKQFNQLKDESNNYQIYKVVKESSLNDFWHSVDDTLKQMHENTSNLNNEVASLKGEVKELKSQVENRDAKLSDQEFQIEHMSFLGIQLTKSTYVTFTWIIIFVLLIIALILFVRFKNANKVTVRTRREFEQLQEDFEAQRKKARETESKIKRDLQTELNRVEELKSQLGEH